MAKAFRLLGLCTDALPGYIHVHVHTYTVIYFRMTHWGMVNFVLVNNYYATMQYCVFMNYDEIIKTAELGNNMIAYSPIP